VLIDPSGEQELFGGGLTLLLCSSSLSSVVKRPPLPAQRPLPFPAVNLSVLPSQTILGEKSAAASGENLDYPGKDGF
jgi:hypothetical protein